MNIAFFDSIESICDLLKYLLAGNLVYWETILNGNFDSFEDVKKCLHSFFNVIIFMIEIHEYCQNIGYRLYKRKKLYLSDSIKRFIYKKLILFI